jgi:hypothetical protein
VDDGSVVVFGGSVVVVEVVVVDGVTAVVVVVTATPVSGDTQPAGGVVAPGCPGISTVPAQPKSENVSSFEVEEPSAKRAIE